MKYDVLKPFFKLSDRNNYNIGDVIELSKEDAKAMLNDGYLAESKAKEATVKKAVIETKENKSVTFSTKQDD